MIREITARMNPATSARKIIKRFADDHGLVYFGSVDQHNDEHQIVRGMTVSHTHDDAHYCIGTYDSYDVTFVERTDAMTVTAKNGAITKKSHLWHIMQVDLKTSHDLPHIFVGLHSHSESFYAQLFTKFSHLRPISVGAIYRHIPAFTMHYRVYARLSQHIEAEKLLTSTISSAFVTNFGALAVEIVDGSLYVYSERAQPNYELFSTMIKNATWLAGHIDNPTTHDEADSLVMR